MGRLGNHLCKTKDYILKKIETIKASGKVAPDGARIVSYCTTKNGRQYWYWKMVASEPVFKGKGGKKTKSVHLGDWQSPECQEAHKTVMRLHKIQIYQRILKKIEEGEKIDNEWQGFKL